MTTLVYKRTHNGDPDSRGRFGIRDCMGSVRSWAFDSVIGVGGQGAEAESNNIARKLNWIGVGAHKMYVQGMDDPIVTFVQFRDFGTDGPLLQSIAPNLARRMYDKRARAVMDFSPLELAEIKGILAMVAGDGESLEVPKQEVPVKLQVCCRRKVRVCRVLDAITPF
jgi:hypothetical protein